MVSIENPRFPTSSFSDTNDKNSLRKLKEFFSYIRLLVLCGERLQYHFYKAKKFTINEEKNTSNVLHHYYLCDII
jgi:hypothetical protein